MSILKNIFTAIDLLIRYGPITMVHYAKNRFYFGLRKHLLNERFIVKKIHNYKMILDMEDIGISRTLLFLELANKIINIFLKKNYDQE